MYAVAGATGNTGAVVAASLLDRGHPVRAIVRSEQKGRTWRDRGAEIAIASLDDAAALARAIDGADGLYYLVPPNLRVADALAYARGLIDLLHGVLSRSTVRHAVFLSSIGAQHETGTGPIRGLHYGEKRLRPLNTQCTFLRAGYFMENTTALLPAIQAQGVLPALFSPDLKIPMVAAQDIGEVAANALLHPPAATEIIELAGPAEYSLADVAAAYARALGRPVTAARVPDDGVVPMLKQGGMSQSVAELVQELSSGFDRGLVALEGGAAGLVRGKVTLDAFVDKVIEASEAGRRGAA